MEADSLLEDNFRSQIPSRRHFGEGIFGGSSPSRRPLFWRQTPHSRRHSLEADPLLEGLLLEADPPSRRAFLEGLLGRAC